MEFLHLFLAATLMSSNDGPTYRKVTLTNLPEHTHDTGFAVAVELSHAAVCCISHGPNV